MQHLLIERRAKRRLFDLNRIQWGGCGLDLGMIKVLEEILSHHHLYSTKDFGPGQRFTVELS